MENPFVFGKVVSGDYFCDREEEMKALISSLRGGISVAVISPRRFGKTSMIINALKTYRVPYLYVDVSTVATKEELLAALISSYFKSASSFERAVSALKRADISFSLSLSPLSVEVHSYSRESLTTFFDLLKKKVVVLDEFQELYSLGRSVVSNIREVMQFGNTFVFSGSRRKMMLNIFSSPKEPFYRSTEMLMLGKISEEEWTKFIKKHFSKTKRKVSEGAINAILESSDLIPFYVQYISHYLWEHGGGDRKDVEYVVERLVESNAYIYEEILLSLPHTQRVALSLLAKGESLFSSDALKRHNVSPQAVNKALNSLVDKGFIDKNGRYYFLDPLFRKWMLNQKV